MFLQSILVYFTLLTIMIFFGVIASKKGKPILDKNQTITVERSFWVPEIIIPIVLFAVIFGMRFDVGVDYLNYMEKYLNRDYAGKKEPFFMLFSDIGWFFNLHYTIYFGILAFIQVFFFFLAFKDERFLYPFLIFFILTNGDVLSWMNIIRQAIAMCIWIFSLRYIDRRRIIPYIICIIVTFLFHRSSIILFIFYPILRKGKDYLKNTPFQLILLIAAFVVRGAFSNIFLRLESVVNFYALFAGDGFYESYSADQILDSFSESKGTGLAFIFKIIINTVIILYSKKLKEFYNTKKFNMVYFLFFIGVLTTYLFPAGLIALTRPFRYFYIFQSIIYAYFAYYLYRNRQTKVNFIYLIGLLVSFLGIFILSQYSATEDSHSLYQFFFEYKIHGYPHIR